MFSVISSQNIAPLETHQSEISTREKIGADKNKSVLHLQTFRPTLKLIL